MLPLSRQLLLLLLFIYRFDQNIDPDEISPILFIPALNVKNKNKNNK